MTQQWTRLRHSLRAILLLWALACHDRSSPAPSAAGAAPQPAPRKQPTPEALAPSTPSSAAVQLDAAKRRALIDGIVRELDAHYIFVDVAAKMGAALRARIAAGDYDRVSDGPAFARVVTEQLRELSGDRHLGVEFGRPSWAVTPPPQDRVERLRRRNFAFGAVERLSGDVARVVINGFVPDSESEVRVAIGGIMTSVADAQALLVDLRNNTGGEPETVAFIASYLFDETPVHLNDIYRRDDNSTRQFWTRREVPGKRFGATKPVYVLTSAKTFSGGEDFAYSLQALKRVRVVGEQTAGGAHPCDAYPLDEPFYIVVPWGRAINPVTNTNWEGVGVTPDVTVPADKALEEAHRLAIADLAAAEPK